MNRTGGCACGAIRFEVTEDFVAVGSCHCIDCQKTSGGGPNYVGLTPRNALKVLKGEVKIFERTGDSGATVQRAFCGDCGTPMWSVPVHEPFIPVKLGALDTVDDLKPQMQIYVSSAPSWHLIDEHQLAFPKMPPQG